MGPRTAPATAAPRCAEPLRVEFLSPPTKNTRNRLPQAWRSLALGHAGAALVHCRHDGGRRAAWRGDRAAWGEWREPCTGWVPAQRRGRHGLGRAQACNKYSQSGYDAQCCNLQAGSRAAGTRRQGWAMSCHCMNVQQQTCASRSSAPPRASAATAGSGTAGPARHHLLGRRTWGGCCWR